MTIFFVLTSLDTVTGHITTVTGAAGPRQFHLALPHTLLVHALSSYSFHSIGYATEASRNHRSSASVHIL
ncbi:hypothetical protein BDR07DRAFT_419156 [Suillus spraguei]|nr:hypothetical protein BDR07DRAFT_419156 [Suillus spraguei]